MNKIIIDDNKLFVIAISSADDICYTNESFPATDNQPIRIDDKLTIKELAEEVINKGIVDNAVLFININLNINSKKRHELCGIELLIWLRIKGVLNHCVLYSFETLHTILNRHPQYLIATTKGTSFLQLPVNLAKAGIAETHLTKLAEPNNIKQVLKSAFSIEEFRHQEANWWGVKALWDVHRVMINDMKANYPSQIVQKFDILNNSIAQYIYEFSVRKIQAVIVAEEAEKKQSYNLTVDKINKLSLKLQPLIERGNANTDEIIKTNKEIEQLANSYLTFNDANISAQIRKLKEDIDFYRVVASLEDEEKEVLETERKSTQDRAEVLKKQVENILIVLREKYTDFVKESSNWITEISAKKPKVLYIDDNAENGWSYVLQKLFKEATFKCIVPDKEYKDNIGRFFVSQIRKMVDLENPTFILLDLRLFAEEDTSIDIENLSGLLLLRLIRRDYPSIPIIVATASNKIWSLKQLTISGADGYWIKEGIDEKRDARSSIENYVSLTRLIAKASDDKYSIIKKLIDYELLLAATQNPWWETGYWANNEKRQGKTREIKNIINASIVMIRLCLQVFHMNRTQVLGSEESYFISSIILRLCSLYEFVHDIDRETFKSLAGGRGGVSYFLENNRGDKSFLVLKKGRNLSAHTEFGNSTWKKLEEAVDKAISYLKNAPNHP